MDNLPSLTLLVWLFLPLGLAGGGLLWFLNHREHQRLIKSGILDVDKMTGLEFEHYLKVLFEKLGYQVVVTPYVAEFGADLIIVKDNIKTAIQAKRYHGKIGIEAIQQVVAAKARYQCQRAMVVTNSNFTQAAWKLAQDNHVTLWWRNRLIEAGLSINRSEKIPS